MAVKSIKVKLRLNDMPEIQAGLWKLHTEVNAGVRYYTEWLSLLRQENLYRRSPSGDGAQECDKTAEQCKAELLERLRARQLENGHRGPAGSDDELLQLARQLYELLVPQARGAKGDAQQISRKFLSPLTDRDAVGGLGISKAGNKPRWVRMRDAGEPGWEEEKAKAEARKSADVTADVLHALADFGLKPLMRVYTESEMSSVQWKPLRQGQAVRTWDRDMFQQAIERMMSWESWNRRVGEEYAKLTEQKNRFEQKNFVGQEHLVKLVHELQLTMKEASPGLESKEQTAHYVTGRALRGADKVFERWEKLAPDAPLDLYETEIKNVQRRNTRRFGSYDLFAKLAEPKYQALWREDASFLTRYAAYNGILRKLNHAKMFATFTLPDPTVHPIWARFDKLGGNLHQYTFLFNEFGEGRHAIRFQKLLKVENGVAKEVDDVTVPISRSTQLDNLLPRGSTEPIALYFRDYGAEQPFEGEFGGAKIQYRRDQLEQLRRRKGAGDVYLNFSVRVQSRSEARGERRPPYAAVFRLIGDNNRAFVHFDKLSDYLAEHPDEGKLGSEGLLSGLRVMSVDLGLRTSASISVFRVAPRDELAPNSKGRVPFYFPIKGNDNLVAIHERSQLLKLPGETESKELRAIREERQRTLRQLRTQLMYLRLLVRCGSEDVRRRERSWAKLTEHPMDGSESITSDWREAFVNELQKLMPLHGVCSDKEWMEAVYESVRRVWRHMGKQVRDWRKDVRSGERPKIRGYKKDVVGGNSIEQIEYLERQYKFLKSWSFFGKVSGQVIRADKGSRFAITLREHIDHAKEDRLKKLADRIIMEALGYVYALDDERGKGKWVAKYPPCQLILLEELSEYQFNNDRPPSENNQLMQWSHRGVFQELLNQAQVHDLLVGTMYAAFSSRFDARTGAPGIRCRRVPARCVKEHNPESFPWWLNRFVAEQQLDPSLLRADDLIPTGEGEVFVSPFSTKEGDFHQIHADLNAAQNLQRRLWSDFDISQIRLRCDRGEVDGEPVLIPRLTGKRTAESYRNKVFYSNTGVTYYERERGKKRGRGLPLEELSEEEAELLVEADEAREKSVVLMRDPSGIINRGDWTTQREFWTLVNQRIEGYLVKQIRSRGSACENTGEI
ncbi:type V CRISPR-associated protein Cas12b [Alicyclobacillus cycloheptanicus]|uniref:Uncharacterized protein n=1 Tax=Alicyclobacillus cycloheptanicus TaxID=1457 RepID=A0ABT9XHT4_9BACL|nr:type V CRISPR-associated protein Cas12b [Alicyclobacillus cycloheptanicus]MDQ0189869.1 hypothetical protein [Alicyclobacillus cycloheptanicus]WDM02449.1 type V CRISPR-associated protein Cas12b [Alicyclobacillus cycloheptanicus]